MLERKDDGLLGLPGERVVKRAVLDVEFSLSGRRGRHRQQQRGDGYISDPAAQAFIHQYSRETRHPTFIHKRHACRFYNSTYSWSPRARPLRPVAAHAPVYDHWMPATAQQILERVFGYADFRGQQRAVIDHAVTGGDSLVLMPTGGGKSLCYQIPALIRNGTAVVVSPLIALMRDQVAALLQAGVRAAYLNSTLSYSAVLDVEARLRAGSIDLL